MQPKQQTPSQILNHILHNDGVCAVATTGLAVGGDKALVDVLDHQLKVFDLPYMADQTSFRVNIGTEQVSILVLRSGAQRIAVAIASGHPIIKSCKRLARRALRKLGEAAATSSDNLADPTPDSNVTAP